MNRCTLHEENRFATIFNELVQNLLLVIVLATLESCERTHSDDIAIASHHRDCLEKMLALVAVHHNAALSLEFPCALINIEHDYVHTKIHGCLLRAQTGTKAIVEKDEHGSLVLAKFLILETVFLYLCGFLKRKLQIAQIFYILKIAHSCYSLLIISKFIVFHSIAV